MGNVIRVVVFARFDGKVSVAAHLRKSRKSGAHFKFYKLPVLVLAVVNGQKGAWAYKAHIAFKHVDYLGEFVKFEFAYYFAYFCKVFVIVFNNGSVLVERYVFALHRAEFIANEFFSVSARSVLP